MSGSMCPATIKLRCHRIHRLSSQTGVTIWYGGRDSQELPGLREPFIGCFYLPLDILKLFDSLKSVASYEEGAVLFDQSQPWDRIFVCPVKAATCCPKNAPPKLSGKHLH
jgi:hypothetical protein